jgi:ribonuclease ZC3H12
VDWFRARGHKEITVFVPKWRKEAARPDNPITGELLKEWESNVTVIHLKIRGCGRVQRYKTVTEVLSEIE